MILGKIDIKIITFFVYFTTASTNKVNYYPDRVRYTRKVAVRCSRSRIAISQYFERKISRIAYVHRWWNLEWLCDFIVFDVELAYGLSFWEHVDRYCPALLGPCVVSFRLNGLFSLVATMNRCREVNRSSFSTKISVPS